MNELTKRERELVAIGAALGSNCASCIEFHLPEARAAGLSEAQIREAVELADAVRTVSARNALQAATAAPAAGAAAAPGEPCAQLERHAPRCC